MNRVELLDKLSLVAPALAKNDLIPILTMLWFTGSDVMAFDDQVAISVPLDTPFQGAIPGGTLLQLLKASMARDVDISVVDDGVLLRAANAKMKLSCMPPDSFLFEMPAPTEGDANKLCVDTPSLLWAIDSCLRSVPNESSNAEQLGITLITDDENLHLFATNNTTISYVSIPLEAPPVFDRVTLPASFCRALAKTDPKKTIILEINEDHALAVTDDSTIFGRLIDTPHPLPFQQIVKKHYDGRTKAVPIPPGLAMIVARASIITESDASGAGTSITITTDSKNQRLARFVSKSARGEVVDVIKLDSGHPEVSLTLEPKFLKSSIAFFDRILITKTCVVLTEETGSSFFFIAGH